MTVESYAADFAAAAEDLLTGLRDAEWEDGFSPRDWAAAEEAGWLDVLRAEEKGGLGLGLPELGVIFRSVGRHLFAGPLLEHAVAVPLVEAAGAEVDGFVAVVFGDGAGTRYADRADTLIVVRDGGVEVVPASAATIMPRRSLDPAVTYGDVSRLPGGDLVPLDVDQLVAALRLMAACELAGLAERSLELAVEYAKQREQFGRPIGSFQAVQHILAEMARRQHGLNALVESAVAAAGEARPLAGRVAKAATALGSREIVEGSLQVHGGIAFTVEHVLHRYYKHVLGLEHLYGGGRELSRELGRMLLERGREPWPEW